MQYPCCIHHEVVISFSSYPSHSRLSILDQVKSDGITSPTHRPRRISAAAMASSRGGTVVASPTQPSNDQGSRRRSRGWMMFFLDPHLQQKRDLLIGVGLQTAGRLCQGQCAAVQDVRLFTGLIDHGVMGKSVLRERTGITRLMG